MYYNGYTMNKKPSFRENITTRYGAREKVTYDAVMALARKMGISISRAQMILVRRGLKAMKE